MSQITLRTNFQIEREARDLAIYNEYQELISVAGASACKVNEHLMNKYGLHSQVENPRSRDPRAHYDLTP